MSLLISLTHYWDGDEIKTDVNIYLSKDNHHDTHYFQSAFEEHAKSYKKYLSEDGVHYINSGMSLTLTLTLTLILTLTNTLYRTQNPNTDHNPNTDGAPSHFKNRFSLAFLLKFGSTVMWGFNAPSHGKGPW